LEAAARKGLEFFPGFACWGFAAAGQQSRYFKGKHIAVPVLYFGCA
jgi:hypothetical protein